MLTAAKLGGSSRRTRSCRVGGETLIPILGFTKGGKRQMIRLVGDLAKMVEEGRKQLDGNLMAGDEAVFLAPKRLREAFRLTFDARATHALPSALPSPPTSWSGPYKELAEAQSLPWPSLADVTGAARAFVDPILSDRELTAWDPTAWTWR
jgi:hypothetical protein